MSLVLAGFNIKPKYITRTFVRSCCVSIEPYRMPPCSHIIFQNSPQPPMSPHYRPRSARLPSTPPCLHAARAGAGSRGRSTCARGSTPGSRAATTPSGASPTSATPDGEGKPHAPARLPLRACARLHPPVIGRHLPPPRALPRLRWPGGAPAAHRHETPPACARRRRVGRECGERGRARRSEEALSRCRE